MSESAQDTPHRRPHEQPAGAPYVELDFLRELEELRSEPEWKRGHNAKTLVKTDSLRIVLMALAPQAQVPRHRTEGRISIQTLSGDIVVRAAGRTFDLRAGALLVLDPGIDHDVEARDVESAFLLTIAWPH